MLVEGRLLRVDVASEGPMQHVCGRVCTVTIQGDLFVQVAVDRSQALLHVRPSPDVRISHRACVWTVGLGRGFLRCAWDQL
eukprot:scaffold1525_cov328-Pavlova_lutheri.AAC.1